jgi:hypothetical protein
MSESADAEVGSADTDERVLMTKGYFCQCRWMDLGILLNASDGIAVIADTTVSCLDL